MSGPWLLRRYAENGFPAVGMIEPRGYTGDPQCVMCCQGHMYLCTPGGRVSATVTVPPTKNMNKHTHTPFQLLNF